jgi:hypothetical protein
VTEALLRQLLLVQDEQAAALSKIEKDVQRLIDGPWETARLYISEATLRGLPSNEVREKLNLAAQQLRTAIPLQEEKTFSRAYVCIDLAIVLTMLRDNAAILYGVQAIGAATGFLLDIKSGKRRPPEFMRDIRKAVDRFMLKNLTIGVDPIGGYKRLFRDRPEEFVKVDANFNAWLASIYQEFDDIERASVALCGNHDPQVSHYQMLVPRGMYYYKSRPVFES